MLLLLALASNRSMSAAVCLAANQLWEFALVYFAAETAASSLRQLKPHAFLNGCAARHAHTRARLWMRRWVTPDIKVFIRGRPAELLQHSGTVLSSVPQAVVFFLRS